MNKEAVKPKFDRRIFWDVDYDKLDIDEKANFVIERVFERGDTPDIRACYHYYGKEKVSEALLNARFMSLSRTYLASAIIDHPLEDFRCYRLRQSNPELFPY